MRPWLGRDGVAAHLAKLSPYPPRYLRIEIAGKKLKLQHYYIGEPQQMSETVVPLRKRP